MERYHTAIAGSLDPARKFYFLVLFLLSASIVLNAQKTDSLAGFNYNSVKAHSHHYKTQIEKDRFFEEAKRNFIRSKFFSKNFLQPTLSEVPAVPKMAMPQPTGCENIDFESNSLAGWTVNGDWAIMSGGMDPYGNFPRVYPGSGNYSLRLNNDNVVNKNNFTATLSRQLNITQQNNFLNLHFAIDILNYPHNGNEAAKFKIQFLDNAGQVLSCPAFTCYFDEMLGPIGIENFQQTPNSPGLNTVNQYFPVTYAPWQTVSLDLSVYMYQTITMQIMCDWCQFNVDWAYCYIDADCYGSYNPTTASCKNMPFDLCGPTGMLGYTWTVPGGGQVTGTNCINVNTAGQYTLLCNPYNTCGQSTSTYTYDVLPMPIAGFDFTSTPCNNTATFVSTSSPNNGSPIASHVWKWGDGSPNTNGVSTTHTFPNIGTQTVTLVVTNMGGCKDSIIQNLFITQPVTFSLINTSNTYTLTCDVQSINLHAATDYTYNPLNYQWTNPTFSATTTSVTISNPGTYTVSAIDPLTGCSMTRTFTIYQNTVAPTASVNPVTQAVTCVTGNPATFTATAMSPSINITTAWYTPQSPYPGGVPSQTCGGVQCPFATNSPGTYTVVHTNNINGCTSTKTVIVTSIQAFPTFLVSSPTNFSVGCAPLHQTTISIINPVSTQTPPSTCSFTFLPPGFAGVLTPSVMLDPVNSSTTTTIPGTWTIVVQDNSNFCRTELAMPVIQNTTAPNVSAALLTQTLICRTPTVLATGLSTTPHTVLRWNVPSVPPNLSTPTVVIGDIANGPPTSTTSLIYANFTVVATNSLNACQSTSVVNIYQNFKPPVSSPGISVGTPTAIYCTAYKSPVVLSAGNSTTTSGGGPLAFVANPCWAGPSPMPSICGASSYSCYVPGIYSLTVEDNYNGCKKTNTVVVVDKTQPPVILSNTVNPILDCGAPSASLVVAVANDDNLKYWYITYPSGTAFSPTMAITPNSNPMLSGTASPTVIVSSTGTFEYLVTNTLTGCIARGSFNVLPGDLEADFTPDLFFGYAPVTVTFTNNTSSALSTSSVLSVWSYGNGASETTTSNISTSTTFTAPGNYTVMLLTKKGDCLDTVYKVIKVDIPSKLQVPNVFTPNGDGSNDVFFLSTTNLGEIYAIIFDRWGNKVYETTSNTGNIAWDGKSLNGKDCAAGVYFYVIKAKGNDAQEYETKGNITLIR